jgi:acetyl esterase/lipase
VKVNTVFIAISIFILLPGIFTGCGSKQKGKTTAVTPPDSVVYKTTPQGELRLYLGYPENWDPDGGYPAMLFFHGGSWSGGGPAAFTRQAKYLAGRGMVTGRVEYRLLGKHGTRPDKCVEDGKSAVRWIREHAPELGVDPGRIVAAGSSAGAHVAACTGVIEGFEAEGENHEISSKPDLLVLFCPAMTTTANAKMIRIMGSYELAESLSPNRSLSEATPAMIMFYGTKDFHLKGAYRTREIADSIGFHAELWTASDQSHSFFKKSPWFEWTLFLADGFLVRHGFLEGKPSVIPPDSVEMTLFEAAGSGGHR